MFNFSWHFSILLLFLHFCWSCQNPQMTRRIHWMIPAFHNEILLLWSFFFLFATSSKSNVIGEGLLLFYWDIQFPCFCSKFNERCACASLLATVLSNGRQNAHDVSMRYPYMILTCSHGFSLCVRARACMCVCACEFLSICLSVITIVTRWLD